MAKLSKGHKGVTIADVARRAGVSIATVSRVLNGTALVAQETAARVQEAIVALKYQPQEAARTLASHKTRTLGLLLSEIGGDFFPPLLRGIEAEAQQAGFSLLISTQRGRVARTVLGSHNTDGLLVFVDSIADIDLVHLAEMNFPTVLIHHSAPAGLDLPSVTVENRAGARHLVDHLIEAHHCHRIAFLRGELGHEDSYWREVGYRESLEAHGIVCEPQWVASGEFSKERSFQVVTDWLQQGMRFDAIFSGDDEAALGVLLALQKAGVRVPEDVAVVGFDDTALARFMAPPLTTVHAPTEDVGRIAVQQLLHLIQGEPAAAVTRLPTRLVVRRSCGCAV